MGLTYFDTYAKQEMPYTATTDMKGWYKVRNPLFPFFSWEHAETTRAQRCQGIHPSPKSTVQ